MKDILCSLIVILNIVKRTVLSKLIYKFNAIPIKTVAGFLQIDKMNLKFIQKFKESPIAKTILKKNRVGRLALPNYKIYGIAKVVETMSY